MWMGMSFFRVSMYVFLVTVELCVSLEGFAAYLADLSALIAFEGFIMHERSFRLVRVCLNLFIFVHKKFPVIRIQMGSLIV
jgi:hypothetical protein